MNVRELEEIPFFFEKNFLLNIYVHLCIYKFGQTGKVMFSNPFVRIVLTEKSKTELTPTAVLLSARGASGKKCV